MIFGSGQGLLESPCECGIEPPGSISHGVSVIGNPILVVMGFKGWCFELVLQGVAFVLRFCGGGIFGLCME